MKLHQRSEMDHYVDNCTDLDNEVTILLTLRRTPTPPLRRKRNSLTRKISTPTPTQGWDLVVEQKDLEKSTTIKIPPRSPSQTRRHSLDCRPGLVKKCSSPSWDVTTFDQNVGFVPVVPEKSPFSLEKRCSVDNRGLLLFIMLIKKKFYYLKIYILF